MVPYAPSKGKESVPPVEWKKERQKHLKRLITAIAAVAMAMATATLMAATETIGGRTWTYSIKDGAAEVSGVSPATGAITVPETLGGKTVTGIGNLAFYNCSGHTGVTIPGSVTHIGDYAFEYCTGLASVTMGNGVAVIGYGAFAACSGLTGIMLPSGVTSIGEYAFTDCGELASVTIPGSVTSIGDYAFKCCTKLWKVLLPASFRTAATLDRMFQGCPAYEDGDLQYEQVGVQVVDGVAWAYTVSGGEATVGGGATDGMAVLPSTTGNIAIPSKLGGYPVTVVKDNAFMTCDRITGVTVPAGVTYIGYHAFSCCYGLTRVTIPDSVTFIGDCSFFFCTALADVYCHAHPSMLTWGSNDDEFMSGKGTKFHVKADHLSGYELNFDWANVTFVGDLGGGTFKVTFSANGGTGGKTFASVGEGRTLGYYMNQLSPKRDGYAFDGWWTAKSGGTQVTATTVVKGDATYYAHWKVSTCAITFHASGGTGGKKFASVAVGSTLGTYMDKVSPKYEANGYSYTFDGWWTERNGGTQVNASTVADGNKTYYAHWKIPTCAITFHASGGTGGKKFASVALGRTLGYYMNQVSPKYEANGYSYTFDGWWTERNGGTQVYADTVVTGGKTYYVHWIIPTCTVTFNANGGTGGKKFASVALGRTLGYYMDQVKPVNGSKTFNGWYTAKTGGSKVSSTTVVTGDVTYYARWK